MAKEKSETPYDPAPSPVSIIEEKARRIVKDVTNSGVEQLVKLRNDIDAAIKALQTEDERMINDIARHAESVSTAIEATKVMRDGFETLQKKITSNVIEPVDRPRGISVMP